MNSFPPAVFSGSSFSDYLFSTAPKLFPTQLTCPPTQNAPTQGTPSRGAALEDVAPHGTTIVALTHRDGVLIAGDRRATMGNVIANHLMKKVFIVDDFTAVGFAGTVGVALEILRLYSIELEHYEKIEGRSLSFSGKVNKLAQMVRQNFPNVQMGLVVAPLLIGFDHGAQLQPAIRDITDADISTDSKNYQCRGKIVSFDILGSRYEEIEGYYAVGSGSLYAKSALKKTYRKNLAPQKALEIAISALIDASDDDSATGGPDLLHHRYPLAISIDKNGAGEVPEDKIAAIVQSLYKKIAEKNSSHSSLRAKGGE